MLALSVVTALAPGTGAADPVAPLLVELQPNPDGPDSGNEWVELANPGPAPIPLDGLFLTEAAGSVLALTGTLPPSASTVVVLPTSFRLNNAGDVLTLTTDPALGEGAVLQQVAYGSQGDLSAPGSGESLAACTLGPVHGAWSSGTASPGTPNAVCSIA